MGKVNHIRNEDKPHTGKNISRVEDYDAYAWRVLFRGKPLKQVVAELNQIWIDPDYELILIEKEKIDPAQLKLFRDG